MTAKTKLGRMELLAFYRLLSFEQGATECAKLGFDRAELMQRLLLRIVPPLETCEAHEARCTGEPGR